MNRFQFENHGRIEIIRLFIEKSYKVLRYDSLIFTFVIKKEQKRKRKQKQKNSYPKKKKEEEKKAWYRPVCASICLSSHPLRETSTPMKSSESLKSHRANNARPLKGNKNKRNRRGERRRQKWEEKTGDGRGEEGGEREKKKEEREETMRRKELDHCPPFPRQSSRCSRTMRKRCTCEQRLVSTSAPRNGVAYVNDTD